MATASKPRSFSSARAFRQWLERNHTTRTELLIRLFKVHASDNGMGYSEALDEALCFGWIDGVRRSVDDVSFSVRFSPRKPRSIWSRVNIKRVEVLIAAERMQRPGLAAYGAREESRTGIYSFERGAATLAPSFAKSLRANKAAHAWFETQAPYYRRTCIHWVMSAKREETRERRLATLIACSAKGTKIPPLA